MPGQIETIEEIPVDVSKAVFFENEKNIGFDPITNEPIFQGSRKMARFQKKMVTNPATGQLEQEMRKHAITGMPLIGVNELKEIYDQSFIYKKVRVKSGGVIREDCEHPDVLWARYKGEAEREKNEARGREILERLGASGKSADEILAALATATQPVPPAVQTTVTVTEGSGAPVPPPTVTEPADPRAGFPETYLPGKWYLSAEHKTAVQAGEQKPFTGTKSQAEDAALIQWEIEAEQAEQSAKIPSF